MSHPKLHTSCVQTVFFALKRTNPGSSRKFWVAHLSGAPLSGFRLSRISPFLRPLISCLGLSGFVGFCLVLSGFVWFVGFCWVLSGSDIFCPVSLDFLSSRKPDTNMKCKALFIFRHAQPHSIIRSIQAEHPDKSKIENPAKSENIFKYELGGRM